MKASFSIGLLAEAGAFVSSRTRAAEFRARILEHVDETGGVAVVDFSGVESVSESFADELVSILVRDRGEEWFRGHVQLKNLSVEVRRSILQAVHCRLEAA